MRQALTLGSTVLVPVTNPASAVGLMRLAAYAASSDGGLLVPVTVVAPDSARDRMEAAHELVGRAEQAARAAGVEARGVVVTNPSVTAGVLEALQQQSASLAVMGWRGFLTRANVFGQLIDSIAGRSHVPLAVVRLDPRTFRRILVPVSEEQLVRGGTEGLALAADLARRFRRETGAPVWVLRTGKEDSPLPDPAAGLSDRVHHDPRPVDQAVAAIAGADDLVLVPVTASPDGLRIATTQVAWAAPHASLMVAIAAGQGPAGDLEPAVRESGAAPPPVLPPVGDVVFHVVAVTARFTSSQPPDVGTLKAALETLGTVAKLRSYEEHQVQCLGAAVHVPASHPNAALSAVMTLLHDDPDFRGAEISYDLR